MHNLRRNAFWTRERVIIGLQNFRADFGFCPTDDGQYNEHVAFTGRAPDGSYSQRAWHQRYPSTYGIAKFFKSMREAWEAAGFEQDRGFMEWTAVEDWFVLESVGIIPRSEVSTLLKRSVPAIKRRLYDLGDIRSYNRWGMTVNHAEKLLRLGASVIRKYIHLGIIPVFKGNKLYYINPADLLKVEEYDWSGPIPEGLDRFIRAAIAQRIAKMAKHGSRWREFEIYQFCKTKDRYHARIKNPRTSAYTKICMPAPNDLKVGDWVTVTNNVLRFVSDISKARKGIIKAIIFSPQGSTRLDGSKRPCYIARVEFPKLRRVRGETSRRIRYSVPLDCLQRTEEPIIPPKPLSMHPEAIRGRQRFANYLQHGRHRFEEIKGELT